MKRDESELSEKKWLEYEHSKRTYKSLLEQAMFFQRETLDDISFSTLSKEMLKKEVETHLGAYEIQAFTVWSANRVYFPVTYDGAGWVESAPRNPCDEEIEPVGGGG